MTTNQRADLVGAISKAASWDEKQAAVTALADFDRARYAQAAQDRSIELADAVVTQTLQPVAVHERSTIETDWLGSFEAKQDGPYNQQVVAEASLWFASRSPEVLADRDEFAIQAEGFMNRVASQYGDGAEAAKAAGLSHVARLWRQAASGLDQVQQLIDTNNSPKTTPLPTQQFDNFAPEVDPVNAGVVGTETSERAPLLQEIEQEGGGQGTPEAPGGHSTTDDFSHGYSEVPATDPASMVSRQGARANDPGHEDCPNHPGQSYATSTGDCSCGSNHRKWASPQNPGGMKQSALDERTMAIGPYLGNLDQVLASIEREGASGLPQIEEIVDTNNQAHPENPTLPKQVAFPWEISDDAYGNEDDRKKKAESNLQAEGAMTYHEQYGDVSNAQLAAYRKHNVPPAMHGELEDYFGPSTQSHKAITSYVKAKGRLNYGDVHRDRPDQSTGALRDEDDHSGGWGRFSSLQGGEPDPFSSAPEQGLQAQANYVAGVLYGMKDGETKTFPHPIGKGEYAVHYNSEQANGDNNKPAKGYHVGTYTVETPDGGSKYFHHTPHGPGLTGAQPYAADKAAAYINDHYRKYVPPMPKKASLQAEADMFGNSDTEHSVMQPGVANSPASTPVPSDDFAKGKADALAGDAPTTSDGRTNPNYAAGYAAGVEQDKASRSADEPRSLGGDSGQSLASAKTGADLHECSKCGHKGQQGIWCANCGAAQKKTASTAFVKQAAGIDPDFRKGYAYASKWTPEKPLVTTGSANFESGLYAGITDNATNQTSWLEAHQRQAAKGMVEFEHRLGVHARVTAALRAQAGDFDGSRWGKCNRCKHDEGAHKATESGGDKKCTKCACDGFELALGKDAMTTTDLDSTGPTSSPDPGGQTPINGPGTKPILDGQKDPAAPGGPSPYNGAEPYGSPAVPNRATPTPGAHTVNDVLGGPVDGNARATAFRRKVQANLLASLNPGA